MKNSVRVSIADLSRKNQQLEIRDCPVLENIMKKNEQSLRPVRHYGAYQRMHNKSPRRKGDREKGILKEYLKKWSKTS